MCLDLCWSVFALQKRLWEGNPRSFQKDYNVELSGKTGNQLTVWRRLIMEAIHLLGLRK